MSPSTCKQKNTTDYKHPPPPPPPHSPATQYKPPYNKNQQMEKYFDQQILSLLQNAYSFSVISPLRCKPLHL